MSPVFDRSTLLLLSATLAVAVLPTVPLPALAQTPAQTPCLQWGVGDGWYAIQANGYQVLFALQRTGNRLKGTGRVNNPPNLTTFGGTFGDTGTPRPVTGTLNGDSIEIDASWGGVYLGKIDITGRIDGTSYDQNNSNSSTTWYSDRRVPCLIRAGDPPLSPAPTPAVKASPPPVNAGNAVAGTVRPGTAAASTLASRPGTVAAMRGAVPQPNSQVALQAPRTACKSGFVWRVARASDLVCVTPQSRDRVAQENRSAATRVQPGGGAYGPNTCRSGFVWREAFAGDVVCVTPQVRDLVRQENQLASSRVQ